MNCKIQITWDTYNEVVRQYYADARRVPLKLRLGQYLYNALDSSGKSFPELFYEEDDEKAKEIFQEHYLEEV